MRAKSAASTPSRKALPGIIAAVFLAAFVPTAARADLSAPPSARREGTHRHDRYVTEVSYTGFTTTTITPYPAVFSQELFSDEGVGSALAAPRDSDDRAKVTLSDVSGRRVAGWVYFIKPGRDSYTARLICPSTKRAVPIDPYYAVVVSLAAGDCGGDASTPTRGKVTFTFTGHQ